MVIEPIGCFFSIQEKERKNKPKYISERIFRLFLVANDEFS
jgi:hypothetical protein